MGKRLELKLPFPPSTNTYWRNVGHKVLISEGGRAYRKAVIDCVRQVVGPKHFDMQVGVTLELVPPDRRRRDIDNYSKALFDALTHAGIWSDDEQIFQLLIKKCEPVKGGGAALVTISELVQTELAV